MNVNSSFLSQTVEMPINCHEHFLIPYLIALICLAIINLMASYQQNQRQQRFALCSGQTVKQLRTDRISEYGVYKRDRTAKAYASLIFVGKKTLLCTL